MSSVRRPATQDEELLAAQLPSVLSEITDPERVERMQIELAHGFAALSEVKRGVSVFGSARVPETSPRYVLAREIGRSLGGAGFDVITGGGPGIMEAVNRGAQDAGARSIGLNIELPFEQAPNAFQDIELTFHYFFTRKVMFVRYGNAFVVMPGGYGTLDELFEALVLVQTGKIRHFPIVLVDSAFWGGLADWLRERLAAEGMIAPSDLELVTVADDPAEVVSIVAAGIEVPRADAPAGDASTNGASATGDATRPAAAPSSPAAP